MISDCITGMIMGILTISLVCMDIFFLHSERSIFHLFFGSIATVILFLLCQRGYEMVNWGLLGIAVLFGILSVVFMQKDITRCNRCMKPKSACGCVRDPCHICKKPKPKCACHRRKVT